MDKRAVDKAKKALAHIRELQNELRGAKALDAFETAWRGFLVEYVRVFTVLEQGAKVNDKSNNWFATKKHIRRTDHVLRYLHHARNCDEHTLHEVTKRDPGGLALASGPGAWKINAKVESGKSVFQVEPLGGQIEGISKAFELLPSRLTLVSVLDRGVQYDPPVNAESQPFLPLDAAEYSIKFLEVMLTEAESLL